MVKILRTPSSVVVEHKGQYIRLKDDEFNELVAVVTSADANDLPMAASHLYPPQGITIQDAESRFGIPSITIRGWVKARRVKVLRRRPILILLESLVSEVEKYYNELGG